MPYRVGVVHTITNSIDDINLLFRQMLPDIDQINIIDDSIVKDVIRSVDVTPAIISRLATYYQICQQIGCCCILNECTSVAFAADIAEKTVDIPVFRIDYPMAKKAAQMGKRIGILATASSTLKSSMRTFRRAAEEVGNPDAAITMYYCENAHKALFQAGDRKRHDEIVLRYAEKASLENDVLALAQGSMAPLAPQVSQFGLPVLTSLHSGVEQIKDYIDSLPALQAT